MSASSVHQQVEQLRCELEPQITTNDGDDGAADDGDDGAAAGGM